MAHSGLAGCVALAATVFRFPPTLYRIYPPCPIHALLGIQCPGCGSTRALAALLHGHLAQAMQFNALFVLLLPFGVAGALAAYLRALSATPFAWPRLPPPVLYATLTLTAIFTVARNL